MIAADRPLILLIGATGVIGSAVIHELAGHARVRVMVRSEHSDAAIARRYPAVERVHADLRERSSLAGAFEQAECVFLLTPSVADQQRLEENALEAALAAGVSRIVYLSSTDVRWDLTLSRAHRMTEQALARTRLAHTVVRAEYLLDNLLLEIEDLVSGRLVAPSGVMRCPFLDARDAGAVAAAALVSDAVLPGPLEVTGPRAMSWAQLAETLGRTLGLRIEHVDPVPEQWARSAVAAGMDPWLAEALREYFAALRGESLQASGDVLRITHRNPRSIDNFAREVLAPAVRRHITPPSVRTADADPHPRRAVRIPIPQRRQHA